MYDSFNRQYVFKQSTGKVWNYYHDKVHGLCYSLFTRRNTWGDPASLQKNVSPPFFMDMDAADRFHILFQDSQGNIFYSLLDSENMKTTPVLSSKSVSSYNKHLNLIPLKNTVHFFYILRHNNAIILAHQTFKDNAVGMPKVIDYAAETALPFSTAVDRSGGIYAFYHSSDGKYFQLGYKKYVPAQGVWGEFIPVTRHKGNIECTRVIVDGKNIMHACYQRTSENLYQLVYQQKIADKNLWTDEAVIHTSSYPFIDSSVLCVENGIIVYWVRDEVIYYSSSPDNGVTWSKPARYQFTAGRQLMCISYKSNLPQEVEKLFSVCIPGTFAGGLKTAFYQGTSEDSVRSLSADEFKNMILDGLKQINISIEELKDADSNIYKEVSSLSESQQKLEKEITKCSVRLELRENELNSLKGEIRAGIGNNDIFREMNSRIEKLEKQLEAYTQNIVKRNRRLLNLDEEDGDKAADKSERQESRGTVLI